MINMSIPNQDVALKPRITVLGVGGAGSNAVNNMIRSELEGVEFVVCNTDAQSLAQSLASRKIQLGRALTQGLGAGARPDVGRSAAEEAIEDILEHLNGANMAFITAGMGGGTGTGAAPVIARAAREMGILTVGVVTKPFQFEGIHRMRLAESGIQELQQFVDTLIVIPNQNLFRIANEKTTFAEAFKMADDVLHSGVRGVTDLMVMPGLINLDFADVRQVMSEMGKAMMGTGEGTGERRALDAAEAAINNPLLDDVSMKGARGVLINITGSHDMTLYEVDEAANRIREEVDPEANIIFGSTFDQSLEGRIRISVIATGIEAEAAAQPKAPRVISLVNRDQQPKPAGRQPSPAAMATAMNAPQPMVQGATALQHEPRMEAPVTQPVVAQPHIEAKVEPVFAPPVVAPVTQAPAAPVAQAPVVAPVAKAKTDEHFVAPPPVDAKTGIRAQPAQKPNAMNEAALVNGGQAPAKPRRWTSILEIVANSSRRPSRQAAEPVMARDAQAPAAEAEASLPLPEPTRSEPKAEAKAPVKAEVAKPQQPELGGLESPTATPTRSAGDDDLLDIPAFLRRQAN
ncbi:MAG TPA: cell division protein FtsZ [Alphaproteobacteria bacterium]|jgi:cell division protein FtsZ|nr:cell division protein FtsZ [Alphaproteobacteria bacterium]